MIFLDMHLPQMDGFELARKIRGLPGLTAKIVAVTAMAMAGDREKIIEAAATTTSRSRSSLTNSGSSLPGT